MDDDRTVFGAWNSAHSQETSLLNLTDLINIQINNSFPTLKDLYIHLEKFDFLHPEHLRPSWDAYFMVGPRINL